MFLRGRRLIPFCLLMLSTAALRAEEGKFEELKEAPQGLAAAVAAAINTTGYRVSGKDGVVCDIWFSKDVPLAAGFKPTLEIKYPFTPGQLMGAIRFPEKSSPGDFRGQNLPAGTYTLRYGQQPVDGNHLGTSDVRDFLLACPPKLDADTKPVANVMDLFKLSAKASGTAHPAIFLLNPPPEKPLTAPAVTHDMMRELLIFSVNVNAKDGAKAVMVPLSVVVVGKSEA